MNTNFGSNRYLTKNLVNISPSIRLFNSRYMSIKHGYEHEHEQ